MGLDGVVRVMDLSDILMDRDREFGAAMAGWADMRRDEAASLADQEKVAAIRDGLSRVAELWRSLPPEAQAAIAGAPVAGAIAGGGQYMASRPMQSGESREEIAAQALRDRLQRTNEASGGGGFIGDTAEGIAQSAVRQAGINKEHPSKAALIAALLGAGGGLGLGAALSRVR
ncbi:MAG: hypothetical protein ABH877_04875 [bacterium]